MVTRQECMAAYLNYRRGSVYLYIYGCGHTWARNPCQVCGVRSTQPSGRAVSRSLVLLRFRIPLSRVVVVGLIVRSG